MKTILLFTLTLFINTAFSGEVKSINDFDLASYKGKVVYLDFWASWCKPCQKSFPWMNEISKKYASDGFVVVTINLDQDKKDMTHFLSKVPADFEIYFDPEGVFAEKYNLLGMPTSLLIDRNGKIIKKHIGFFKKQIPKLEAEIKALL